LRGVSLRLAKTVGPRVVYSRLSQPSRSFACLWQPEIRRPGEAVPRVSQPPLPFPAPLEPLPLGPPPWFVRRPTAERKCRRHGSRTPRTSSLGETGAALGPGATPCDRWRFHLVIHLISPTHSPPSGREEHPLRPPSCHFSTSAERWPMLQPSRTPRLAYRTGRASRARAAREMSKGGR
jgi:hypothetical protein